MQLINPKTNVKGFDEAAFADWFESVAESREPEKEYKLFYHESLRFALYEMIWQQRRDEDMSYTLYSAFTKTGKNEVFTISN